MVFGLWQKPQNYDADMPIKQSYGNDRWKNPLKAVEILMENQSEEFS